ncbi:MAG TPA: HEAT repeat domain-containing protein, partial [Ktedonobacteraceae bacterium]|nr:HEAT repeat domain-containing protein [Ktedonobacteraceae bacterium]
MTSHEKQLVSRHITQSPAPDISTQAATTRAPASAVNAIMGRLGLARESDEPKGDEEMLARALVDPSRTVRIEAAQKLGKMGKQTPLELLLLALRDEESSVRTAAARALARNPRQAAIPALVSALEDPEWIVRAEAARALGSLPMSTPLEALLPIAQDKDPAVRSAAIWALRDFEAEHILEPLNVALQDEDWSVRETAALALSQIGERTAIPALLNARMDSDLLVRSAAEEGLQQRYPEFSETPPQPSDCFSSWLERTDYPHKHEDARTSNSSRSDTQPPKEARAYVFHPISKLKNLPVLTRWPRTLERLAEGLLATFILTSLLASWFLIATWPRQALLSNQSPPSTAFTTYRAHNSSVDQLAWSPDGMAIASVDSRSTLRVWSASSGQTFITYPQQGRALALTWMKPTIALVVYAKPDKALQVVAFNIGLGAPIQMLFQQSNLPGIPEVAAWSSDGETLAFDTGEGPIQIWNVFKNRLLTTIKNSPTYYTRIFWSPDKKQLATISMSGWLQIWDASTGKDVVNLAGSQQVHIATWVVYDQRSTCMLFVNSNGEVVRWEPKEGSTALDALIPQGTYNLANTSNLSVEALSISPNSEQLTMATSDGIVQARDSTTMGLIDIYRGHSAQVNTVEWSPDGRYIATGSSDTTVQV